MADLGYDVTVRTMRDCDVGKEHHDDFKYFEHIFIEAIFPDFYTYHFTDHAFRSHLIEAADKTIFFGVDPNQLPKMMKLKDYEYGLKQFSRDFWRHYFKDDEDIARWSDFNKRSIERRFIIPTFYEHEEASKDNLISISFASFFKKVSVNADFEDKLDRVVTVIGSSFRPMKKMKLAKYGLKEEDVVRLGSYRIANKTEEGRTVLSEDEVQEAYARSRFAFSPSPSHAAFSWIRSRFIYCAMHKTIMLGTAPEIEYYGEPYILDKTVFNKSLAELKEIAEAQSSYFFSHLISPEQSISNLKKALTM